MLTIHSPEFTTILLSAMPVFELRVGLPYALWAGIPLKTAFALAVIANSLATILFFLLLDPIVLFARRHWPWLDRVIQKIFAKTRHAHSKSIDRLGALFLVIFIAVPIPGSGSYTAAVIAYLFGLPLRIAAWSLFLGTFAAGLAMLGLTGAWVFLTKVF